MGTIRFRGAASIDLCAALLSVVCLAALPILRETRSLVNVIAGHDYIVKLTPMGVLSSTADVTGLFITG